MSAVAELETRTRDNALQHGIDTRPDSDGTLAYLTLSIQSVVEESLSKNSHSVAKALAPFEAALKTAESLHDLHRALVQLAKCLKTPLLDGKQWARHMLSGLARLSKLIPNVRSLYGLMKRVPKEQVWANGSPDCILELARQMLELQQGDDEELRANVQPALRLIANCCADDNVNRSLIVNRGGIEILRVLAKKQSDDQPFGTEDNQLDLILPTLYNICTDFDEPATDLLGNPLVIDSTMSEPNSTEEPATLSQAEYLLGGHVSFGGDKPAIFMFLGLMNKCPTKNIDVLADMIELASRSFLITKNMDNPYLENVVGGDTDHPGSMRLQVGRWLRDELAYVGTELASKSSDAQASICQTWLNILSQQEVRDGLATSATAIEKFIDLPYSRPAAGDDDEGLEQYQEAFLKVVYDISGLPEYVNTHPPDSPFLSGLAHRLTAYEEDGALSSTSHVSSLPSVLVLIANALAEESHISAFLELNPICEPLKRVLLATNNEAVMLPALNLATRLALSHIGQDRLVAADPNFEILQRLLGTTSLTSQLPAQTSSQQRKHTLAIQQEAIALTRLMIKGNPSATVSFTEKAPLHALFQGFGRTLDTVFKLSASRLTIEILRTIATPCAASHAPTIARHITHPSTLPTTIAALIFPLTTTSTPAARSESLFGIALFSSLFTSRSSPHHNPSALNPLLSPFHHDEKLLPLITHISSTKGQGNSKADYENLQVFLTHTLSASKEQKSPSPSSVVVVNNDDESESETVLRKLKTIADAIGLEPSIADKT